MTKFENPLLNRTIPGVKVILSFKEKGKDKLHSVEVLDKASQRRHTHLFGKPTFDDPYISASAIGEVTNMLNNDAKRIIVTAGDELVLWDNIDKESFSIEKKPADIPIKISDW